VLKPIKTGFGYGGFMNRLTPESQTSFDWNRFRFRQIESGFDKLKPVVSKPVSVSTNQISS